MAKVSAKPTPDEVAVLLPEVEIGPYVVKPWSYGRFKKVLPAIIEQLIPALKAQGITYDNIEQILGDKGIEIFMAALPAFSALITATLDISEAQIDEMDFDQPVAIGLTIIVQNLDRIKNVLPLIMSQFKAVIRAT